MRRLVLGLDAWLRRRLDIREFSDDPDCLFRIRVCRAARSPAAAAAPIPADAVVVELHLWNERFARLPKPGADLRWGARGTRLLARSLSLLAGHLRDAPDLDRAAAVVGVTAFASEREAATARRLLARLGFETAPYRSPLGRLGALGENVHAWLIRRAFGDTAPPPHRLARQPRLAAWIGREDLLRRHAPSAAEAVTGHPPVREDAGTTGGAEIDTASMGRAADRMAGDP